MSEALSWTSTDSIQARGGPAADAPVRCIGFLGADWWGSDARAMAAELRRRGHLVLERHYEDHFPTRWRHPGLRGLRRVLRPLMARDYNRAVEDLLDVRSLDFLLAFKGMLLAPATLRRFKERGISCYCYYPDVSFHDHGDNIARCLPLYDCVFTSKPYHLEDESLRGVATELVHAPHGFDPEVHRPVRTPGGALHQVYGCDVSFVGSWSPKKEATLEGLLDRVMAIDVKIWGPGWHRAAGKVQDRWQGRGAYGDELAVIYSLSRINLGLLSEAGTGVREGDRTTARTWQIPGAGGFLLHEDTSDIRGAFRPEEEVALFDSLDALGRQVRRYLPDEAARRAVARAGHRRALEAPYTYGRAVDIILGHHAERQRSR